MLGAQSEERPQQKKAADAAQIANPSIVWELRRGVAFDGSRMRAAG
jgi:hypothetical protein